jgi:hypothetical protein
MLISCARLGPCEILAPLGAGGMGEVYRRFRMLPDLPFGHRSAGLAARAVASRAALRIFQTRVVNCETWSRRV